jgi:hypothetical protein
LIDDVGKDPTVAGRPEAEFSDYLIPAQRRLATTETLPTTPPVEPAKPRAAIVLPSLAEADADKPAAGALVQQPQETTLAFSIPQPQSVVAGDVVSGDRFYRFSGGGAGGGGAGGAVAQGGAASFDTVDRVPVLGDVPMLGKAFRESETLKRDGAVLAAPSAAPS